MRALHRVVHVPANTPAAIRAAVHELLRELPSAPEHVVISAVFASTADLDAAFPATAARESGVQGAVLGLRAAGGSAPRIEMLAHVHTCAAIGPRSRSIDMPQPLDDLARVADDV